MKALSLWQPWATLLVGGKKSIETMAYPMPFAIREQRVAIHAAKKWSHELAALCLEYPFDACLRELHIEDPDDLPLGAIVGFVTFLWSIEITPGATLREVDMVERASAGKVSSSGKEKNHAGCE